VHIFIKDMHGILG